MEQIQGFLPIILLFLVMYLFLIRPQMKKAKQEKQFAAQLKKGDRVITTGGLHGKILELSDDGTCVIESLAGKMKFERSAISMERTAKLNAPVKEKK
ncbi:preprotein translocase subunit YajC [Aequorivita sp. 609]|uniref:Sec translocon accessory complex subunit YajC n=1 Tax=Aequorivita xiaoshiensis TaxID=2874476 RepID=A0A9X1U703_9FLAO|nr:MULTISPECIES: preprotein translocase subunit YajC [Aequorivita]MBB6682664.1 preprotein translocase subunit YajC [Aequorivita sp. 609]MCG2431712.1 preprotein translocase subunit YajC [Aequorivita xiaoshiensis]NGX85121.1 preprotein translocase subunit YajC [Aequorivita sp. KMM 9714]